MYKVLKSFYDLQDDNYFYEEGKSYPRENVTVLPSRIKELATNENRMGEPLIVEVEKETKPKKTVKKVEKD